MARIASPFFFFADNQLRADLPPPLFFIAIDMCFSEVKARPSPSWQPPSCLYLRRAPFTARLRSDLKSFFCLVRGRSCVLLKPIYEIPPGEQTPFSTI